jgi:hypothetical protein
MTKKKSTHRHPESKIVYETVTDVETDRAILVWPLIEIISRLNQQFHEAELPVIA